MTFIEPDEFIIAVDYRGFYGTGLNVPEIAQLREAGVRTMLQHPIWRNIETSFGHYDWATTDEMADLAQRGGVKLLLQLGEIAPGFSRMTGICATTPASFIATCTMRGRPARAAN